MRDEFDGFARSSKKVGLSVSQFGMMDMVVFDGIDAWDFFFFEKGSGK